MRFIYTLIHHLCTLTIRADNSCVPRVIGTAADRTPMIVVTIKQCSLISPATDVVQPDCPVSSAVVGAVGHRPDGIVKSGRSTSYEGSVVVPVCVADCAPCTVVEHLNDSLVLTAREGAVGVTYT